MVLSIPETPALLDAMSGTPRLMAALIYNGGLRVSECCELRIKDIDFDQGLVLVRRGLEVERHNRHVAAALQPAFGLTGVRGEAVQARTQVGPEAGGRWSYRSTRSFSSVVVKNSWVRSAASSGPSDHFMRRYL